jgi:hypothetical protein
MENVISKFIEVSRQVRKTLRGMDAAVAFSSLKHELEKSVPKVDKALPPGVLSAVDDSRCRFHYS